jgi:mRNA-degrading endonuclease RelE of RelBE toxin-antitoxin system
MPTGILSIRSVVDKKIQGEIGKVIGGLTKNPEIQGKPLDRELSGIRSIPAYKNRFRILYRIGDNNIAVLWVGQRKPGQDEDVYVKARKLYKTFLRDL